jgi:hypothetical protein
MNAATLIWVSIAGLWILLSMIIAYQDVRDRRVLDWHIELRDWERKVEAMRRICDEEGDA